MQERRNTTANTFITLAHRYVVVQNGAAFVKNCFTEIVFLSPVCGTSKITMYIISIINDLRGFPMIDMAFDEFVYHNRIISLTQRINSTLIFSTSYVNDSHPQLTLLSHNDINNSTLVDLTSDTHLSYDIPITTKD